MNNNVVLFDNRQIYVTDIDGVKVVGLRSILKNIGLDEIKAKSTVRKLQGDYVLSKALHKDALVNSEGGVQTMTAIDIEYLPIAIAKISITPTMRKSQPIICEKLKLYQLECAKVLMRHFGMEHNGTIEKEMRMMVETFADQNRRMEHSEKELIGIEHNMRNVKANTTEALTIATNLEKRIAAIEKLHTYTDRERIARLIERWKTVTKNYQPHLFTCLQGNSRGKMGFYGAIENRFDITFPKNCTKSYEVTKLVPLEDVEDFIMGIGTKYLISQGGIWYNAVNGAQDKYDLGKMERFFYVKDKKGGPFENHHTTNCYICGEKLKSSLYTLEHTIPKWKWEGDEAPRMELIFNLAPTGHYEIQQCNCNAVKSWDKEPVDMKNEGLMDNAMYQKYRLWTELMAPLKEDGEIILNNFRKAMGD